MIRQKCNCFGLLRFALLQTTLCKYRSKIGDNKEIHYIIFVNLAHDFMKPSIFEGAVKAYAKRQ